jgi:hypothetical protein
MSDIERVAAAMGMKPHREVQEVVPVDDGYAAHTHDGRWTLVRDDGTTSPCEAPEMVVERDHGTAEPEQVADPEKPATKRRGRS